MKGLCEQLQIYHEMSPSSFFFRMTFFYLFVALNLEILVFAAFVPCFIFPVDTQMSLLCAFLNFVDIIINRPGVAGAVL